MASSCFAAAVATALFGALLLVTRIDAATISRRSTLGALYREDPFRSGGPVEMNCTVQDLGETWLEITNLVTWDQYKSTTNAKASALPSPLPFPWSFSTGQRYSAPAFYGACISRSPGVPQNCTQNCTVTMNLFNLTWVKFGILDCMGSTPVPGLTTAGQPLPPPGNVSITLTEQCKNYLYTKGNWMASVTDPWGNKWALQTASFPMSNTTDWRRNVYSVKFPPRYKLNWETLVQDQIHEPWVPEDGSSCYIVVMRDSNGNAWHMYQYESDVMARFRCYKLRTRDAVSGAGK